LQVKNLNNFTPRYDNIIEHHGKEIFKFIKTSLKKNKLFILLLVNVELTLGYVLGYLTASEVQVELKSI